MDYLNLKSYLDIGINSQNVQGNVRGFPDSTTEWNRLQRPVS